MCLLASKILTTRKAKAIATQTYTILKPTPNISKAKIEAVNGILVAAAKNEQIEIKIIIIAYFSGNTPSEMKTCEKR